MLGTPICFLMSIYAAFVYGMFMSLSIYVYYFAKRLNYYTAILYANLEGFSIEYQENRGWGAVVGNLSFIALLIGIIFAAAVNILNNRYYFRIFRANGNKAVPEARLPPMMAGGFAFTGGMFLYGCKILSSYTQVHNLCLY